MRDCPACGWDSSSYLGRLGKLLWFRCVACGIDWHGNAEDWSADID